MRPAAIVAITNTAMAALHHEATSIPVVFINVSDPVGVGYVDSLAHPGHNVTGLTPFEPSLGSKWLSFLKQLAPSIQDAGVIFNPEPGNNSGSFLRAIESAAPSLAVKSSRRTSTARTLSALLSASEKRQGRAVWFFFQTLSLTYAEIKSFSSLLSSISRQSIPGATLSSLVVSCLTDRMRRMQMNCFDRLRTTSIASSTARNRLECRCKHPQNWY